MSGGRGERAVAWWLLFCCGMIFAMVMIGGVTRLTLSGLSITEWQLVTGILPPLSDVSWAAEFEKYRQIPQYTQLNRGMSLAEFKNIYFWEYVHRLWGRLIGVVYALPLIYFLVRRQIPRRLVLPLAGIFLLGAAQGALGWYMVTSGLADRVSVSQYRLVAHLALALAIYAATLWIALGILVARSPLPNPPPLAGEGADRAPAANPLPREPSPSPSMGEGRGGGEAAARWSDGLLPARSPPPNPPPSGGRALKCDNAARERGRAGEGTFPLWRRAAEVVIALVATTIIAGGFVAGLHAGLTYNTFPLMDGSLVPAGYARLQPFWLNWFENIAAVQFNHRLLASLTAAAVLLLWIAGQRSAALPHSAKLVLHALTLAVLLQFMLGVITLLLVVPVPLGAAHQAGAVVVLTAAIVFRQVLKPAAA